jgi:TonB family protein
METIEPSHSASKGTEHEINFLLVRDTSGDWPRWKRAAIGSGIFHLIAITLLFIIRSGPYEPPPPERYHAPYVTKLYIPKELTQKAPNKGPVAKLMLTQPTAPTPKVTAPAPPKTQGASPKPPVPVPVPVTPPPAPPAPVVAPPAPVQGETARNQPPAATPPAAVVPKPDAPKIIVDDSLQAHPPAPALGGKLSVPVDPIQEAMRQAGNRGNESSGARLGDSADMSVGAGLHLPASAARLSNFELKSDPMGVDFQPYLQRVLAAVKLNWTAVYPTAAKLGTRGLVTLEFSISKDGRVVKLVFDGRSGSNALDNAAVAAISASDPLPSLPKEFKGDRIILQMSFMYNIPR